MAEVLTLTCPCTFSKAYESGGGYATCHLLYTFPARFLVMIGVTIHYVGCHVANATRAP